MTRLAALAKSPPEGNFGAVFDAHVWPPCNEFQINFLLCILKGFALSKPLCWTINDVLKRDRFTIGA